ncbi:MAG: GrpB family protein [Bacteroidota bacterium]
MLLQPYDTQWPADFESICIILRQTLEGYAIRIEHIGSTAVPGLAAKPIIDIDLVYPNNDIFPTIQQQLNTIGYQHVGDQGIAQREVFKRLGAPQHPVLDSIRHHLYLCPPHSEELKRHLAFRDYLRQHEAARQTYQALKLDIAAATHQDRKAYAALKQERARDFIEQILTAHQNSQHQP